MKSTPADLANVPTINGSGSVAAILLKWRE